MAALLAAAPCSAVTVTDLYETSQPVETSRDAAFLDALKAVVVRVSGQRDAAARLGAALNNPRQYVQRFGFTADGTLQVGFDSVSIDRLLSDSGLPIWGRERPATLVLLAIEEADGSSRWIGADAPAVEKDIVAKAARLRGLPLRWAAMDTQDRIQADAGDQTALPQLAARYGANAVLLGRGRSGAMRWSLVSSEGNAEASGMFEDGVHMAADTFAQVFAASGTSLGNVTLEVSGIGDLDAYAATLNYLESMTLVRGVAVEQVSGETLRLRLAVRGDASTLRRAIALDDRLVPLVQAEQSVTGSDRLTFRYQR